MKMQFKAMILFVLIAATSSSQAYFGESLWNKVVAFAGQKIINHKASYIAAATALGIAMVCCYRKYCASKLQEFQIYSLRDGNHSIKNDFKIAYTRLQCSPDFMFHLYRLFEDKLLVSAPRMRIFYKQDCLVVFCANRDSIIYNARVYIKDDLTILPAIKGDCHKLSDIKSVALIKEEGGFKLKISLDF